mgnify:CR=1 FL=1
MLGCNLACSSEEIDSLKLSVYFPYLRMIWPHDHKLRKYLSLKVNFEYLKFYWTQCFNNLQIRTNCTLKHIFKILVYQQN